MQEDHMPPSVTSNNANGGKKNKKKDKTNVQQVQPQPQTQPLCSNENMEEEKIEPVEVIEKDDKNDVHLIDASPPIAPPRLRTSSTPTAPATRIAQSTASANTKHVREKSPTIRYIKGQVVKAVPVSSSSIVNSVAEFVQENMQQSQSLTIVPEKIEWVQFHTMEKSCDKKYDVIVMGLLRGFQIWVKYDNGDFEEVLSERQGPIKSFVFLSPSEKHNEIKENKNPMIAFVDAFSHVHDRQFSTVSVIDLTSKKVVRLPSAIEAYEESVTCLLSSNKFLVVALTTRIFIYETINFTKLNSFRIATPPEGSSAVCAVYNGLLAYADDNLNTDKQSCGGIEAGPEEPATYTGQTFNVLKAISSTMKNLGESVTGTGTNKGQNSPQGIVTVVNIEGNKEHSTIAHFVAHYDQLAHISWSPDGRLLLTSDLNGYSFHVFCLMPHPTTSSLAAVQHLYRLHRGNTAAKIYCTAFTVDCRWIAVATNHGTTHIFAINPYGGKPTVATHGDGFTNKESRFLRSAGLTESSENVSYIPRSRTHSGQIQVNKEHPALNHKILARCSGNPRIGSFGPPLLLTAVSKIRDSRISTENMSAWVADLNPVAIGTKKGRTIELPRTALLFSSRQIATKGAFSLLIARADNGIYEYELKPKSGQIENIEKSPGLEISSLSMWVLHRTKNNPDIPPPLQIGSPLVTFEKQREKNITNREAWIPQLEITTYSVPSRRLWQGPQFSFFQFSEDLTEVIAPNSNSIAVIKSIPIVVGDKSIDRDDYPAETTRIECGSWVSQNSITMAPDDSELSLRIADAMREVHIDSGVRQNSSIEDFASFSPRYDARSHSGDELLQFDDI